MVHAFSLAAGQSVNLLLQFAPNRTPFPLTNSQLQAYGVPAYNVSAPSNPGTPVTVVSTNIVRLPSGNMLVQFQSTSNRTYTVVYSDNASFSNALLALPPVRAQANWVQWMDYGPPETMSAPGTTSTRFYRVFANP